MEKGGECTFLACYYCTNYMNDVTFFVAFINGLLSFFTPCILPLLPVYFSYLAGEAITDYEDNKINWKLLINAIGFVLGITLLNILLGFGVYSITSSLTKYENIIRIVGGILLILFGTYFVFNFKTMFLEKTRRVNYKNYSPSFLKSFILGITFSFGWTPCNGPILASILIMAGFEQNYFKAGSLMLTYSLGFSILFLLSAILVGIFIKKVKKIYTYLGIIKKVSGVIMILMGILLITNKIGILSINL